MLGLNLQASYIAEREMLDVSITLSVGEFTLFYFSPQHSIWLDFSLFRQTEFSIITFFDCENSFNNNVCYCFFNLGQQFATFFVL